MIDKKTLLKNLKEGEGLFIEFKSSLEKVDRTMVAFANTQGGVIYLGVHDDGTLGSFKLTNRIQAQVSDMVNNIDPSLSVICVPLGEITAILIKEGEDKPYKCSDGFFIRVGATNQKLSRDEILELALRFNRLRFETLQETGFNYLKDFSKKNFDIFVKESNLEEVEKTLGVENFLHSLGVCERQRGRLIFNHAGILFFAKNPQKFVPQAVINYTRYQGHSKVSVIDRMIYQGNLPDQVDAVIKKLKFDIPTTYRLAGLSKRIEMPHYPPRALEEAIVNAVVHRDYFENGGEILIDYYSDRIEITNPGSLPPLWDINKMENKSIRRNPIIAELFYRLNKSEKLGSGISRMKALMNEWKLAPPQFKSEGNFFSVIFNGPKPTVSEEKHLNLPERSSRFLDLRNQISEPFDTKTYADLMQVTQRSAQKDLGTLLKKKIVKREGEGKNTRYWFAT